MTKAKKSGMDLGKVLLWAAVLVESPRWAGAMVAADVSEIHPTLSAILNFSNAVAGFAMGIVVVVATAYLLDALRGTKPSVAVRRNKKTVDRANPRFWGLLVFVGGLLALTPFVLGPYIVSRMTGKTIAAALVSPFWQYVWSVAVVVAPAFVIGGVAFAQPGLVTIGVSEGLKVSESDLQLSKKVSEMEKALQEGSKKVQETESEYPETFGKWQRWPDVPLEEQLKITRMNAQQVQDVYGVSEKTSYNWLKYAERDHGVIGEVRQFSMANVSEEIGVE